MSNINYEQLPNEQNQNIENTNASAYEKKRNIRKIGEAAFEGFATFLFMCAIFFTKGDAAVFAFGMWVILTVFGPISGAHVNPAITIGFYFTEQDWVYGLIKMSLYITFQFIGCIAGIFLGVVIVGEHTFEIHSKLVGVTSWEIFFAEFFFTGTFFFIIAIATHAKYPPCKIGAINCAIIVAWFYCAVISGAKLSGAAYNPAVLLALNVSSKIDLKADSLKQIPVMVLGEILGVIFFAMVFKFIFNPFYEMVNDEKNKPAETKEFVEAKIKEEQV